MGPTKTFQMSLSCWTINADNWDWQYGKFDVFFLFYFVHISFVKIANKLYKVIVVAASTPLQVSQFFTLSSFNASCSLFRCQLPITNKIVRRLQYRYDLNADWTTNVTGLIGTNPNHQKSKAKILQLHHGSSILVAVTSVLVCNCILVPKKLKSIDQQSHKIVIDQICNSCRDWTAWVIRSLVRNVSALLIMHGYRSCRMLPFILGLTQYCVCVFRWPKI